MQSLLSHHNKEQTKCCITNNIKVATSLVALESNSVFYKCFYVCINCINRFGIYIKHITFNLTTKTDYFFVRQPLKSNSALCMLKSTKIYNAKLSIRSFTFIIRVDFSVSGIRRVGSLSKKSSKHWIRNHTQPNTQSILYFWTPGII